MPHNELDSLIAKLKEEVTHLQDDQQGSRDQIELLINDLETHVANDETNMWPAEMTSRVGEQLEQFETDHPQITGILNNIMVTLSSMGI
jgi:hypothetical protein